jgi:MFS family permease
VSRVDQNGAPAVATGEATRGFLAALIALAFAMNAIGRGISETFAVFLLPVEAALGVERAAIATTYSIYMLAYGLAAPFAGQLIDRLGVRACYTVGLLALGSGYLGGAEAWSIWHYYLGVGVLGGIGAAALGMVAASSLLARWFSGRLMSISALPYAAVGAGMLVFPPLTQLLIDAHGWRAAHRLLGGLALALVPLLFVLPLDRMTAGSTLWRSRRADAVASGTGWTARAALATGAFWALFLAYFMTAVAAYSVLPHSIAHLVEQGFDPLTAAAAFGFNGLLSAVGIVLVGWLADRIGWLTTVTGSYLSTIAGVACLLAVMAWPSLALVYAFVVGFGLMQGARGPILVGLVARIFSAGAVGTIFGMLSMALGLGAAAGSFAAGLLYEWSGHYAGAFVLSMAASAIGLATFRLTPSLRQERVIRGAPPGNSPT